jgi:uncharacterized protein Yka (UPF0111/DUF47 family)
MQQVYHHEILLKLADNSRSDYETAEIVSLHIDKLPENIRSLFLKLVDNRARAAAIVYALYNNFDKLSENVQNLLFKPTDNVSNVSYV